VAVPTVLEIARAYAAAGLSVLPIRADGSKAPACASWKPYQRRRATAGELASWFAGDGPGIAIVCGAVSGNLEVLDFDDPGAFLRWEEGLEEKAPGLLRTLPQVATPGGGRHVYYRLPGPPEGNRKLLRGAGAKAFIETRGEGGYVLAPGSPPACHPTGGLYRHIAGPPLTDIPQLRGDLQ
jgi:hypothetical protein